MTKSDKSLAKLFNGDSFEQQSQATPPGFQISRDKAGWQWHDFECSHVQHNACHSEVHWTATPPSPVPEPFSLLLISAGLVVIWMWVRKFNYKS